MNKWFKSIVAVGLTSIFLSACGDADQFEEPTPQDDIQEEQEDVNEEQEDVNEEEEDVQEEQQEEE